GLRRTGPAADAATRALVRAAFAHRRKSLARSLEHGRPGALAAARAALAELGLPEDARAEALSPEDFAALSAKLSPT
ncbi:MAG TPA: ribosomal RNA small subunit methyltransferase A, partial [Solirubrobacterales bacterium]